MRQGVGPAGGCDFIWSILMLVSSRTHRLTPPLAEESSHPQLDLMRFPLFLINFSVSFAMMFFAEPHNIQGFGIVFMVSINSLVVSTPFAGLAN
tara:strand:- start:5535 stop:5816 length:282 start_codon:yes stop_codon:yes gene_type:complete